MTAPSQTPRGGRPAARPDPACRVCGSPDLRLVRRGNLPDRLGPEAVRITDAGYGRTADIYACGSCGFLQCPDLSDVLALYAEMDDEGYAETSGPRALQARKLLETVAAEKPGGRLLDVGAGSGILVGEALAMGYDAVGIEPSGPLHARAVAAGLPVVHGVLPCAALEGQRFDVVTLIDVIEHVPEPVELLRSIAACLSESGICLLVTPDVRSVAARLMGWRWWHFRIAHIGYFSLQTLDLAASRASLRRTRTARPTWYFPASYLAERAGAYLPAAIRPPVPRFLDRVIVPLNLFDSLLVVLRPAADRAG